MALSTLERTTFSDKNAAFLGMQTTGEHEGRVEKATAKFIYWTILAIVFVAFFDQLGIEAVTEPLLTPLKSMTGALPSILKALIIGLVGFLLATGLRRLVVLLLDRTGLMQKLDRLTGDAPTESKTGEASPLAKTKTTEPSPRGIGLSGARRAIG